MIPKYNIGQRVIIRAAQNHTLSPRDCALETFVDQNGIITEYYWINPRGREIFYIYAVRLDTNNKEIVLHEDEIEVYKE